MSKGTFFSVSLLVAAILSSSPADARVVLRKKVERHFPDRITCAFVGQLNLAFVAGSTEAKLTFSAVDVDAEPIVIDTLVVVERELFADRFRAVPSDECMDGAEPYYQGDATDQNLVADPGDWSALANASVDGSGLRLGTGTGSEAEATVRVTGLRPGREYFITGSSDRGDFDVEVDESPPPAFFLQNGRFRIEVRWAAGRLAGIRPLSEESTALYFGDEDHYVLLVSAIDNCRPDGGGTFWLSFAGTQSQKLKITITDTTTGIRKTYQNAEGTRLKSVVDKATFRCRR